MSNLEQVVDITDRILPVDTTSADQLREYFEDGYAPRLFNPLEDDAATRRLLTMRDQWRDEGATVVLTSGVFDVMHANHRGYLLATRLSGVATHFATHEADGDKQAWSKIDAPAQRRYAHHVLSTGLIRQIVSVDGDTAVAERKGFTPSKGNMARPVYGWESRARDVLSASFAAPDGTGSRFLADAVTIHDRVEPTFATTPHAGIMEIGFGLQPDVWAIYHESQDIIDAIRVDAADKKLLSTTSAIIIENSDGLYSDTKLGQPFSTTALARRIGGVGLGQAS